MVLYQNLFYTKMHFQYCIAIVTIFLDVISKTSYYPDSSFIIVNPTVYYNYIF